MLCNIVKVWEKRIRCSWRNHSHRYIRWWRIQIIRIRTIIDQSYIVVLCCSLSSASPSCYCNNVVDSLKSLIVCKGCINNTLRTICVAGINLILLAKACKRAYAVKSSWFFLHSCCQIIKTLRVINADCRINIYPLKESRPSRTNNPSNILITIRYNYRNTWITWDFVYYLNF